MAQGPNHQDPSWLNALLLVASALTLSLTLVLAYRGWKENRVLHPSDRADPLHPPNPAKAPWYFVGIQEMLSHSATLGGIVIPALIGLFLFFSPLLDRSKEAGGRWFGRGRLTLNLTFALIFLGQFCLIIVGQWFRTKNWVFKFPW
jgi:quinol-cytochrome oxidoreductase complex cytochrome b subunit